MKTCYTTNGDRFLVDEEDYDLVLQHKWHLNSGYVARYYGLVGKVRKQMYLHIEIMGKKDGCEIDHINMDRLDNRKSNLRFATRSQNMLNKKPRNNVSSKYRGVSWHKYTAKWIVHIAINRKNTHIGLFENEEEAALAYNAKAIEFHGEFAKLNYVSNNETWADFYKLRFSSSV